jgi:ketosteroid isomerase-like protein
MFTWVTSSDVICVNIFDWSSEMSQWVIWSLALGVLFSSGCASQAAARGGAGLVPGEPVDDTRDGFAIDPWRAIVRAKVIEGFARLSVGDPSYVLGLMSDDVEYTFEGRHALGGTRVSKRGVERWFARLLHLLPGKFTLRSVELRGGPSACTVYTVFEDQVTPLVGAPYRNHGVQVAELRWGKVVRVHTYVDTALVESALNTIRDAGVEEASAAPITD